MLDPEPEKRPTSSQLLSDPLLRSKEQIDFMNIKAKNKILKTQLSEKQIKIGQLETMLEHYMKQQKERDDERDRQIREDRERMIRLEAMFTSQKSNDLGTNVFHH